MAELFDRLMDAGRAAIESAVDEIDGLTKAGPALSGRAVLAAAVLVRLDNAPTGREHEYAALLSQELGVLIAEGLKQLLVERAGATAFLRHGGAA